MHIRKATLDDLLHAVLARLLKSKNWINPTKRWATELTGVLLEIDEPRARLSRTELKGTLFSCWGELLWYLAGSNDLKFIQYYLKGYDKFSDDGETVHGGYGPRLFGTRGHYHDQVANIIRILRTKRHSRQAVIQLFDAADVAKKHEDVPCTCTLQFMRRKGRLHMFTNMRSNDAFIGLPHDVFAFTMLQEIIARSLGVALGAYKHAVGSLHLYEVNRADAGKYLNAGWQPTTTTMPRMPAKNPWVSIRKILKAEREIRCGRKINVGSLRLDAYWADVVRLLQIYAHFRQREGDQIERLKGKMTVRLYDPYIDDKKKSAEKGA